MGHDHSHDDPKTYYVEQLCTIGIAGALGGIAVMLYLQRDDRLWFLAPKVQPWVLAGGIALLVLVVIRAAVVWVQAGRTPQSAHDHDHDHHHDHCHDHSHGEACDHDREHAHAVSAVPLSVPPVAADHDHDHGHSHAHGDGHGHDHSHGHGHGGGSDDGHEHGWAPWRFVILLVPVAFFFLGFPNKDMQGADPRMATAENVAVKHVEDKDKGEVVTIDFPELQRAPATPETRAIYEGRTIRVKGEFLPGNERMFTLVRYKMNCCARDAVPLSAIIVLDPSYNGQLTPDLWRGKWVEVEGQVQFQQQPDRPDVRRTLIVLRPNSADDLGKMVKVVKAESS
jgi:hypothetical protein